MNLHDKSLRLAFLAAIALTLLTPFVFPGLKIHYFIPCIVLLFYQKSFVACLWGSLTSGLFLGLLSAPTMLGLYAINYTLTTALLYGQRKHFFADSVSTLPLMTFFYSAVSAAIEAVLFNLFDTGPKISAPWMLTDLLILPAVDALFAFSAFILPFLLFGRPIRKGKDYFQA